VDALGIKTDKQFLKHLIPQVFNETVYQSKKHWACDVKGFKLSGQQWADIQQDIKTAFGSNLIEIEVKSSQGVRFIVYLRRDL